MRGADKLFTENVANDCEGPSDLSGSMSRRGWRGRGRKSLFLMHGCSDHVYVWADSFEQAFEELVEWLDKHNHHCLTNIGEAELREAADDLGIDWNDDWLGPSHDYNDADWINVQDHAEADLTPITHTQLIHGTHIPSDEWGGNDVDDYDEIEAVARHSMALCNDHEFLVGDYVWYVSDDDPSVRGKFIVDDINRGDIDIESIPPGEGVRGVASHELEFFDPAKHGAPRRFHTREAFDAEEETFDGLPRRQRLMDLFRRRR